MGRRRRPGRAAEPAAGPCSARRPWSLSRPGTGEKPRSGAPSGQAGPARAAGRCARAPDASSGRGPGSRRVNGASPAPVPQPPARFSRVAVRRPRPAPRGKAKTSPGRRFRAGDCRVTPAPIPGKKLLRSKESPDLHPPLGGETRSPRSQPTCAAPSRSWYLCGPLRGRRGEALPMAGPHRALRARGAGALWKEWSRNLRSQCGASPENTRGALRNRLRTSPRRQKQDQDASPALSLSTLTS